MKVSARSNSVLFSAVTAVSLLALSGCNSGSSTNNEVVQGTEVAVIAAVGSDFGSSSISIAESKNAEEIVNNYAASDLSDMRVAMYRDHFYRIGRYNQDNITKYSFDNPGVVEWQFSVNGEGETGSNPYDIIFVSETKAYVLRYGSSKMWIVDPSVTAADEANFKLGEIDLSAYDQTDNKPEMAAGILADGRLYVMLQAMDTEGGYIPGDAYVVVIDTTTDTEVNTGKGGDLAGIPLSVKNPYDFDIRNGELFVTGAGKFYPTEYTGGIEKINLTDYSTSIVLDDGDDTNHPYGQITGLEFISDNELVFRGYASWGSESLYRLNLTTNDISGFYGVEGQNVKTIAVDDDSRLWVGLGYAQGVNDAVIRIINPENETLVSELPVNKDPSQIVFGRRTN